MQIKICCISSDEEVDAAVAAGANALGFVSSQARKVRHVSDEAIVRMAARVPLGVRTAVLTPLIDADAILTHHGHLPVDALQLVNRPVLDTLRALRRRRSDWLLWQSVHVAGPEAVDLARAVAPWVDGLILDSGNVNGGRLGGTGVVHDWTVSRQIRDAVPDRFLWLAGGLRASNVEAAVRAVCPDGVDVCTGVRTAGRLDDACLVRFTHGARAAGGSGRGPCPERRPTPAG
ncbi:MAG: phosphoribosylanthranilate isomerase [Myxococcales bacterium]|nr:phosphoribosylanthranilate isomerase [Myxococcales bacterium]MCB9526536.1 phosphoribosylanthranilate isomerase [Myxococcales bacterium]